MRRSFLRSVGGVLWIGMLLSALFLNGAASEHALVAAPPTEEEKSPHILGKGATVVDGGGGGHAKVIDPAKLAATEQAYRKWVNEKGIGKGPMTLAAMQEIYRTGDFETVKTLIENKVISSDHSTDMADHRILMIFQTWETIVNESNGKYRVHRSDSGNQKAGMSSDVDQTIYVEEFKDGRWVRAEDADGKMVEAFKRKFEDMHKLKVETLDIATIAGRDKYPDWRVTEVQVDAEGKRQFRVHAAETMFTLRRTPGAYTFCGAVVQQMQLRVMDAMEKQMRAGREGPAIEEPREIRIAELKQHNPEFKLNHLLFNTIEADPETGKARAKEAFREDAVRVMFDGLPPKLVAGHAYDAAVANYFEFLHHIHDKNPAVKYHLRALDDGFQMLERLRKGTARTEYGSLMREQRADHMKRIFGESLASAPKDINGKTFLDRWQMAFDISADLRDLHSKKLLTDQTAAEAFKPLAEELAGKDKANWKNYLDAARNEYNRRCQEFMVHNIVETSHQRIAEFLSPDPDSPEKQAFLEKVIDEGTLRKTLKLESKLHDAKWLQIREEFLRNYSEQARLQLLYSFRELNSTRPDIVQFILKEAERRGRTPEQMALLKSLESDSRSMFFGLREFAKFPKTYARYAQLAAQAKVSALAHSLMNHLAGQYGFIETADGIRPTQLFEKLGMTSFHEHIQGVLKGRKFLAITDRFLGNMFLNIGAVQSGANVLRAYSMSGGDTAELQKAMVHEFILMLPGIGQIVASYEAGSDWKQQAMIIVPLLVPELGIVLAVYGIGDAGIAIYNNEYIAPLQNDIADALYRGYVGPSLYEFSVENRPPEFTEEDQKNLDKAQAEIKRYAARVQEPTATKGDAQALAIAGRDERVLSVKKSSWQAYLVEQHRFEGSAIAGKGKHLQQKVLDVPKPKDELFKDEPAGPLLAGIKPVIFYSRNVNEGPVDFTIKPLSDAEKSRLEELEKRLTADAESDPRQWVDLETEWAALSKRKKMSERAARYLEAAKTKPELMLQIRLDSLWPNLKDKEGITTKEKWARDWAATWVAIRKEVLPDALKAVDVEVNENAKPHTAAVLDAMGERLKNDIERSRRLWLINQVTEEARAKWEKEQIEKKKGALMAEQLANAGSRPPMTLSETVQQILVAAGSDPKEAASLVTLADAYMQRNIPESAPTVQISMRRVPKADEESKSPYEFRPDVKVRANPAIYLPPYSAFTYSLDPKAAQEAMSAKNYKGLPLSDEMVKSLAEYLKTVKPGKGGAGGGENDKFNPAVLTFVFCADVRIPQRNVVETVAHLPELKAYDIPMPEGMEKLDAQDLAALDADKQAGPRGYLFGGGAFSAPAEAEIVAAPFNIFTRRVDQMFLLTSVVLKDDAFASLDPKKPNHGVRFILERAPAEGGPWETLKGSLDFFGDYKKPKDQEISFSDPVLNDFISGKLKYQPQFYRVAMYAVSRNGATVTTAPSAAAIYSNIAGPGQPFVKMAMRRPPEEEAKDKIGTGRLQMTKMWIDTGVDNNMFVAATSNNYFNFNCELISPNQYYNYPETHYTVSSGGFTGHYFDPPVEHYSKPDGRSGWDKREVIIVPFNPNARTITIKADSPEGAASRTLNVSFDPKLLEQVKTRDEQLKKQYDQTISTRKRTGEEAQARVKYYEGEVAKNAAQLDRADRALAWCDNSRTLADARHNLATYVEHNWLREDANYKFNAAQNNGDHAASLDSAKVLLALYEKRYNIDVAKLKSLIDINTKRLAYCNQFKMSTKDAEAEAESLKKQLEQRETYYKKDERISPLMQVKAAALYAGDGASYKAALDELLRLQIDKGMTESAAETMIKGAEEYVMISGDRAGAARYYNEGWDLRLSKMKSPQLESSKQYRESHKPSWLK